MTFESGSHPLVDGGYDIRLQFSRIPKQSGAGRLTFDVGPNPGWLMCELSAENRLSANLNSHLPSGQTYADNNGTGRVCSFRASGIF